MDAPAGDEGELVHDRQVGGVEHCDARLGAAGLERHGDQPSSDLVRDELQHDVGNASEIVGTGGAGAVLLGERLEESVLGEGVDLEQTGPHLAADHLLVAQRPE